MTRQPPQPAERAEGDPNGDSGFHSEIIERLRSGSGTWDLPNGRLCLPEVFGLCRGVIRALEMLQRAVAEHAGGLGRLFLLGQIIHNPWVNAYFQKRGVRLLSADELARLEEVVTPADIAVIPAFGVTLPIQQRLNAIGCQTIDTTCGDVRRLWRWVERSATEGCGVVVFGRATHDETVVTAGRLEAVGGKYVIAANLAEMQRLCDLLAAGASAEEFRQAFAPPATNAETLEPFSRLAQASQTTMLYSDTMAVRQMLREAFENRYGVDEGAQRLQFEPTVCRATQDRQAAADELCRSGVDLVVVVGGYGSSNTRHLFELARAHAPAWFIEDASSILSPQTIRTLDPKSNQPVEADGWLPPGRPVTIGVLAGASSPDVVVGEILHKLAEFLA